MTGSAVPYKIVDRREGDISVMYANPELAEIELGWKAKHTIEEMCKILIPILKVLIDKKKLTCSQVSTFGDGKR